jgi:hypothetical protein
MSNSEQVQGERSTDQPDQPDQGYNRSDFFNILNPITLPLVEFDFWWSQTDNFWTKGRSWTNKDGTKVDIYHCKLKMYHKSSGRVPDENGNYTIQRHATRHPKGLCDTILRVEKKDGSVTLKTNLEHSHGIDESDLRKYPTAVRTAIRHEVNRGLSSSVIKQVINQTKEEAVLSLPSLERLKKDSQFIYNQVYPTLVATRHLYDSKGFDQDLLDALSELDNSEKYRYSILHENNSIIGLVWVFKSLENLMVKHGILFQMDSTHNINIHGWNLFNFVYRDNYGVWLTGAHMLLANEQHTTIFLGLKSLRELLPQWTPRYALVDDSAAEQKALKMAFRGVEAGEQELDTFLCIIHSFRTIHRNVPVIPVRHALYGALRSRTRLGCEANLTRAFEACPSGYPSLLDYLRREWNLENSKKWAMWARDHSLILKQTTSTNAVEAFHNQLKSHSKMIGKTCNFVGAIKAVELVTESTLIRRQKAIETSKKETWLSEKYAVIKKLPSTMQQLLESEYVSALNLFNAGDEPDTVVTAPNCKCNFFSKYLLPCQHIFYQEILYGMKNSLTC